MERGICHCSSNPLQQLAVDLGQSTLSFDRILNIGSELAGHLEMVSSCGRCIVTKRKIHMLSQATSRLVGFYEAAHLNAAGTAETCTGSTGSKLKNQAGATPSSPNSAGEMQKTGLSVTMKSPEHRSLSSPMRLGGLAIVGAEARILGQVVLIDACLELHERMQDWKLAMDESLETVEEPDDAAIGHSLDRLAKLIGLLQYDGYSGERWQ
jgi:hypothetical protein